MKPSTKIFFILLGFRLQKLPSMENSALLSSKSPILAGSSDPSRILSRRWRVFPTLRGVGGTRRQIRLASAIKGGSNDGAPQKVSDNAFVYVSSQEVLQKDSGYSVDSGEPLLDSVKWDEKGLAVAIAQDVDTGAILMQGFANREALATTISSRKATFYSRSRSSLWTKGETSMNFINVDDIFLDCDRDSIIYLGKPDGPTCHTGAEACYYTSVADLSEDPQTKKERLASTTLYSLEATISQRNADIETPKNGKPSWTKRLLLDKELLSSKILEEAAELTETVNEDKSRVASEMADLLYHCMVFLCSQDVKMEDVLEVLRERFSQSGIEEKSSRKPKDLSC